MGAIAERQGSKRSYPVKAGVVLASNTPGVLVNGLLTGVVVAGGQSAGVTTFEVDNSTGADAAIYAEVKSGEHKFANSGDINNSHAGQTAYFVDASNLSISDGTGTRSAAGTITQVDADGVWVSLGI